MDEKAKEELRQIANELSKLRKEMVIGHSLCASCNMKLAKIEVRIKLLKDENGIYLLT